MGLKNCKTLQESQLPKLGKKNQVALKQSFNGQLTKVYTMTLGISVLKNISLLHTKI